MTRSTCRRADFQTHVPVFGPSRGKSLVAALAIASLCLLTLGAGTASATFHLMQVREVYAGSALAPESQYVELQMWAQKQNLVAGHVLRSYDAGGVVIGATTLPADVPDGADQSTILITTPQAESQFELVADAPLSGALAPAGGAVCWENIDCVSWGSFSGALPSPAGTPAAPSGIPEGMALRRSIGRGCPTLLDPEDDHDNSAADFAIVFPGPRPNSVPPSERPCAGEGGETGGSGAAGGQDAPRTLLRGKPARRTADRTPTFRFRSDEADARFECRLDRRAFRRCRSPFTSRRLALGRHRFQVRARDSEGRVDPTPASYRFRVVAAG